MESSNFAMWLILTLIFIGCCYWHIRENNQLAARWKTIFDTSSVEWLTRFAWSRTVQLLLSLACCIILIIMYDWQLTESRNTIYELEQAAAKPSQPTSEPAPEKSPPDVKPVAATDFLPKPPMAETSTETVADIYNPEQATTGNQSAMDDIKKRYENVLVTYLFLKKCNKVQINDYHVIISALSQEMASVNAPGRLQNDILTAAQGSYKEMYSQSSCDDTGMNMLYIQYANYINTLSQQFSQ